MTMPTFTQIKKILIACVFNINGDSVTDKAMRASAEVGDLLYYVQHARVLLNDPSQPFNRATIIMVIRLLVLALFFDEAVTKEHLKVKED